MEVVLLVGLQGAGKSTLYRERFAATHAHLSMDLWPSARRPRARLHRELEAALAAGRDVVCDSTNVRREERAPLLALAKRHGARVRAILIDATVGEAKGRNALRTGRARVPDVAIHATRARWEEPTADEGFDAIDRVRLADNGFVDSSAVERPSVGTTLSTPGGASRR